MGRPTDQGDNAVSTALAQASESLRDHERTVLGFVAYFGTLGKDQLLDLLSQSGIRREIAQNVAERLAIAGVLQDTGHHYLVVDRRLIPSAAAFVEDDVIKLINEGRSNGP